MSPPPATSRVYLLRHARAGWADLDGRDFDRKLDRKGRGDAARMGLEMAERGLVPARVLCSPAPRCAETWEIIARHLGTAEVTYTESLYDGDVRDYLGAITGAGPPGSVLVCGHNPMMAETAEALLATTRGEGAAIARRGFKKCGLAVIDIAGPLSEAGHAPARLSAYLLPSDL
jgi:phosphohistidine phosphatase